MSQCQQWVLRSGVAQLWGTGARAPSTSNNFSWCRCQQLAALSISALVTKLLVIEQLLHPALKLAVSIP